MSMITTIVGGVTQCAATVAGAAAQAFSASRTIGIQIPGATPEPPLPGQANMKKAGKKAEKDKSAKKAQEAAIEAKKTKRRELDSELTRLYKKKSEAPAEQAAQWDEKIEKQKIAVKEAKDDVDKLSKELKEELKEIANAAHDKEVAASQKKFELMQKRAEGASELAGVLCELQGLKNTIDHLAKAYAGLETARICLGRVKMTFTMVVLFWDSVKKHCESLDEEVPAMLDNLELADHLDEWLPVVGHGVASWACLGLICCTANKAVTDALIRSNETMKNLPTQAEAYKMCNDNNKFELLLQRCAEDQADAEQEMLVLAAYE